MAKSHWPSPAAFTFLHPHTSRQLPLRTTKDKSLMGLNLDQEQEDETRQ